MNGGAPRLTEDVYRSFLKDNEYNSNNTVNSQLIWTVIIHTCYATFLQKPIEIFFVVEKYSVLVTHLLVTSSPEKFVLKCNNIESKKYCPFNANMCAIQCAVKEATKFI